MNKMTKSIYAENFDEERQQRENEKYSPRLPIPQMAAHAHVYEKHSIEPVYGIYDRPLTSSPT